MTLLGHAGLLVQAGGSTVLVDPLLRDDIASGSLCFHPGRRLNLAALPPVTHLAISHGHLDHFDPPSLRDLPRDLPVLAPGDEWLVGELKSLGFKDVIPLDPWEWWENGDLRILATPSRFEIDEIGFVFAEGGSAFWHVTDTIIDEPVGRRVRSEVGSVTAASAKYQSGRVLVSHQRNLGAAVVDKDDLVDGLEAVCAAEPGFVFPYVWGVAYRGDHAWANRYSAPYTPQETARMLARRMGEGVEVATPVPGDVLEVTRDGVTVHAQGSPFVRHVPVDVEEWEPVDVDTLVGLDRSDERADLHERLERYLVDVFGPWLHPLITDPLGPLRALVDWGVVWQLVVHTGDGEREHYALDFRQPVLKLRRSRHPDANYFVHLGGSDLLRVLRGDAGAELFWLCGGARLHEKILFVRDGRIGAPPVQGWDLHERLPDPFTLCLRKQGLESPAG